MCGLRGERRQKIWNAFQTDLELITARGSRQGMIAARFVIVLFLVNYYYGSYDEELCFGHNLTRARFPSRDK